MQSGVGAAQQPWQIARMKSVSRAELLLSPLIPHRYIAAQLRQPSGPFGRIVMTRVLNRGNAELISGTVDALALSRSDAFMDVGFGGGLGLQLAAARTDGPLWGVDFSADVVLAASSTLRKPIAAGRLNVICADVADLPLRDGLVQAICTTNTIYFWPDPLAGLRSLRRVLSQGGRLALGFSGAGKMRDFGKVTTHGFTIYEPERVESLMREAGFSQVQTLAQHGKLSRGDYVCLAQ
jgi:SAM-dependent methyltransferase